MMIYFVFCFTASILLLFNQFVIFYLFLAILSCLFFFFFFFKQKTAYEIGLGIPAEPLFRSRQLNSLQNTWPYGYSMPIAVRYTQDAFSRSGWLWPVDAKGEPLKATSYMAVGFYVAKYVNKKSDMDLAAKGLGAKEWNN